MVTNGGDTASVVSGTEGCYLAEHDPSDFASKLDMALQFAREHRFTKGRERIIELGMDADSIAQRVIDVYQQLVESPDSLELGVDS